MTIKDFVEKNICVRFDNPGDMARFLAMCDKEGLKWKDGRSAKEIVFGTKACGFFCIYTKCLYLTMLWRGEYEMVNAKEFFNEGKKVSAEKKEPSYRVVIDCDGKNTTAKMQVNGRTVKVATAKKNPDDAFNLTKACGIVMDRLFAKKKDNGKVKDGDIVQVRQDLDCGKYYGKNIFVRSMEQYRGFIGEAHGITDTGFHIIGTDETWNFTDEMVNIIMRRDKHGKY